MKPATLSELRTIRFSQFAEDGVLTVFPEHASAVPFPIVRLFTIAGVSEHGARANHAHRYCTQLLACLSGRVTVSIADGRNREVREIAPDGEGLLVPPMLWNSVTFDGPTTVLAVFCDKPYDPSDYLRSWDEYLALQTG